MILMQSALIVDAQEEQHLPQIMLHYFSSNNSVQWLEVKATIKTNNKIEPVGKLPVQVYLDRIEPTNKIAAFQTNELGVFKTFLPVALKEKWKAANKHTFIAVASANGNEITTELPIIKAKIILDTLNEDGLRSIRAEVYFLDSGGWLPAKDVEVKIGVQRMGGAILIGDEASYTTDSLGRVVGEFKTDSLPSIDKTGNITLVAWTEDNELFGNIVSEKRVPWGRYSPIKNNFGRRSLWATRDRAPVWLLVSAYSIIAGVWGVLIYLLIQLITIRKLGRNDEVFRKPLKTVGKAVH